MKSISLQPDVQTVNQASQCGIQVIFHGATVQWRIWFLFFLLFNIVYTAHSQQDQGLLSKDDTCQLRPPQIITPLQTASIVPAIVRLAYVIPSNRTPQVNGVANFQNIVKQGQRWFATQMKRNGMEAKSFNLELEADGITPRVHVINIAETDEQLRGSGDGLDIWNRTINAASTAGVSVWANGEIWVLIPEIHLMHPDGTVAGDVALGAGWGNGSLPGVTMIGSKALALFDPSVISDDTSYDGEIFPAIGPYPMRQDYTFPWFEGTSLSSAASSWVGALFHEMGHAFGLAHDFRNDDNFHGNLMGNGLRGMRGSLYPDRYPNDYTRLEYTSALILDVNHFFNQGFIDAPAPMVVSNVPATILPQQGLVHIVFQASDNDSLSVAHLRYNGDAVSELVLEGTTTDTVFVTPYFTPGVNNRYTIAVHDKQGNTTYTDIATDIVSGYNQAPFPYIKIYPPEPGPNQEILLDASRSTDTDDEESALQVMWDIDNDGRFDTQPTTNKVLSFQYNVPNNYLVRLKVIDSKGAESFSTPVSIAIPGAITLTLLDGHTGKDIQVLKDGDTIRLLQTGSLLDIRANIASGVIERVAFDLTGPISHHHVDKRYPYRLFDRHHGKTKAGYFLPGTYTLTVRAYNKRMLIATHTISFKIIDGFTINSLMLIDASTDTDRGILSDGDIIDLSLLDCDKLSIRADATPHLLDKVLFNLNGPIDYFRVERFFPYSLFGDIVNPDHTTDYRGWKLSPGTYTLTATPYAGNVRGEPYSISFTVVLSTTTNEATLKVSVYPIPALEKIGIVHSGNIHNAYMTLLNSTGEALVHKPLSSLTAEELDISDFEKGIYYLKITSSEGVQIIRLIFK
ncbi:T9SS type A sorting domain-containing protein [Ohtaekwangia kribbensis]|uniref:T9SS type A sorting domain-containing protein n=1 Tax=Ohtaekwangia kribbensis TaxID=688913 RepID=A0ABW3JVU5_9BACT